MPDGNIEFWGRKDNQVKIRGYRIELNEIEHHLLAKAEIDNASVLVKESPEGNKSLIAYLVFNKKMNSDLLKSYLAEKLPEYMIPNLFKEVENIPLTNNGKVNKKALLALALEETASKVSYVAPRDEVEEKVAKVWEKNIGRKKISEFMIISLNWVGHSLSTIQLVQKLSKSI